MRDHHPVRNIMIRVKTILGKIFSLKTSDRQLFSSAIQAFSPSRAVCPRCGAIGCCDFHDYYTRWLISIENDKRSDMLISIPRVLCRSCGHPHAILPDVLIPYGSYSLRFILVILDGYLARTSTVREFCASWGIAVSTLYGWIHLFEKQASLWLDILKQVKSLSASSIHEICSQDSLPAFFFERFGFSFLQFCRFRPATLSRKVPDSS